MQTNNESTTETSARSSKRGFIRGHLALMGGLTAGLIAISGLAFAGGGRPFGHEGRIPGMMMLNLITRLDLSEQQELQAIRIRKNLTKQGHDARTEMAGNMKTVVAELEKPAPDATKIHGVADQAIARFQKIVHSGIDQLLQLHATLTAEQRSTLVEQARKRLDRAEQGNEGRDGHGGKKRELRQ